MKRHYTLNAEPGCYALTGAPTRGILGATYTGRSIDVEGRYPEAKRWVESYEASQAIAPQLEQELLDSLASSEKEIGTLFRGRLLGAPPRSLLEFGPPPPDRARQGRYNAAGVDKRDGTAAKSDPVVVSQPHTKAHYPIPAG